MDYIDRSNTKSLYRAVLKLNLWKDSVFSQINGHSGLGSKKITEFPFNKIMTYYFQDFINVTSDKEKMSVFDKLAEQLVKETNIPLEDMLKILNEVKVKDSPLMEIKRSEEPSKIKKGLVVVSIGEIKITISPKTLQRVGSSFKGEHKEEYVTRSLLRYSLLIVTPGFSWSLDPKIFNYATSFKDKPVLECFASPFNYNIKNYCSVSNEDIILGAKGNFFDYIGHLDIPVRLICNPPYTEKVLDRAAKECIRYVRSTPGSECLFVYPAWSGIEGLNQIHGYPESQKYEAKKGSYVVYDHIGDELIPSGATLFFVLISNGPSSMKISEIQTILNGSVRIKK